ncbi:MAG: Maf family protein [Kiritimatiellaeota bacterium]|nr:Maf family protein [Kiritimatiellota bacterium]
MRPETEIILASQSPRRRALLKLLGVPFRVVPPRHDERRRPGEAAVDYAVRNARAKARSVLPLVADGAGGRSRRRIILGADTIVVRNGRVLEKPRDAGQARAMLRALSGRRHQVITGLCFLSSRPPAPPVARTLTVHTNVWFRALRPAEVDAYVATGEPLDKAGAYAIQGGAAHMVREIHGSYTNVVGLPLAEVAATLGKLLRLSRRR